MNIIYLIVSFYILTSVKVYAYLDPGTGSIIIQYIIAGLVAGLTIFKTLWSRAKDFYKSLINRLNKKKNNN